MIPGVASMQMRLLGTQWSTRAGRGSSVVVVLRDRLGGGTLTTDTLQCLFRRHMLLLVVVLSQAETELTILLPQLSEC